MTKFANNNMTAIELFNKRKEFKNNLNESGYQNLLIDLVYDNPYYGRVNKSFRPVYYNGLSNKAPRNTGSSVFVQDFIADAYDDFIDHIQEAIKLKKKTSLWNKRLYVAGVKLLSKKSSQALFSQN